jgi:hypothetical protein
MVKRSINLLKGKIKIQSVQDFQIMMLWYFILILGTAFIALIIYLIQKPF